MTGLNETYTEYVLTSTYTEEGEETVDTQVFHDPDILRQEVGTLLKDGYKLSDLSLRLRRIRRTVLSEAPADVAAYL